MRIRYFVVPTLLAAAVTLAAPTRAHAQNRSSDLKIAVVDVEGGAATLFLTPEGRSLLIDTGWPPGVGEWHPQGTKAAPAAAGSSADRIAAAAAALGIKKIDYLEMTHYHRDHVGGVRSLLEKLPVDTFIDHGPNREQLPPNASEQQRAGASATLYPQWVAAYQGHHHITAHAGETLKIGSLKIEFVSGDGTIISKPLAGGGQANPLCANVPKLERNGGEENERSLGERITFGKTQILYLGDLTWNKELELLCPDNKVGRVDVYFVTGHGMNLSSSPPTAAFDPLVAIMQNGPMKGGDEAVIKTVDSYPDLKGFWRLHSTVRYPQLDGDLNYIANLNEQPDHAYPLALEITPAGKITVTNPRNQFSKSYEARAAQ